MTAKILVAFVAIISGMVVGAVTGVAHRSQPWWGVAGCIVLVGAAALFVRAWRQWLGFVLFAVGWLGVSTIAAMEGPGGSILIADDALGRTLLVGGAVAIVVVALTPRAWVLGKPDVAY